MTKGLTMISNPHVFRRHPVILEWHNNASGGIGGERVGWQECMDHIPVQVMSLFMEDEELEEIHLFDKDGWPIEYSVQWFSKKKFKRWKQKQKAELERMNSEYDGGF